MAKKSAKSKGFRKQTGKKPYLSKKEIILLIAILAVLIAAAIALFSYDDGALKVKDGAVVTEGDNWLIVNGSNTRGGTRYYKLGEIGALEGYTRDTQVIGADANIPEYRFTPEAGGEGIDSIGVVTSHNTAEALASYSSGTFASVDSYEVSDVQTLELDGGITARYYIYSIDYASLAEETAADAEDEEGAEEVSGEAAGEVAEEVPEAEGETDEAEEEATTFTKYLSGYMDASHDSCIVVQVVDSAVSADACVDDEALVEALRQALAAVTLEDNK